MAYRILVLFAHPAPQKSGINRQPIAAIRGLENVTINDLYEEYPDSYIDVKREQRLLIDYDIIIFQHPFFLGGHRKICSKTHACVFGSASDETAQFLSCSPPLPHGSAVAVTGKFKILAANGDKIKNLAQ